MKTTAIVLAAGSGSRMGSDVKKQFLLLNGYPLLYYSLKTFEESFIDEIILVAQKEDIPYCSEKIVREYGFKKITQIVPGGDTRAHSVKCGLDAVGNCDFVFIHDGARPLVTKDILERALSDVQKYDAAVVGVKSKDTVKIASPEGFVADTPDRSLVWNVQTPQVFRFLLIKEAYDAVLSHEAEYEAKGIRITDDAMVLEAYSGHPVFLTEGSYRNIKVTTPEDLTAAAQYIKEERISG